MTGQTIRCAFNNVLSIMLLVIIIILFVWAVVFVISALPIIIFGMYGVEFNDPSPFFNFITNLLYITLYPTGILFVVTLIWSIIIEGIVWVTQSTQCSKT